MRSTTSAGVYGRYPYTRVWQCEFTVLTTRGCLGTAQCSAGAGRWGSGATGARALVYMKAANGKDFLVRATLGQAAGCMRVQWLAATPEHRTHMNTLQSLVLRRTSPVGPTSRLAHLHTRWARGRGTWGQQTKVGARHRPISAVTRGVGNGLPRGAALCHMRLTCLRQVALGLFVSSTSKGGMRLPPKLQAQAVTATLDGNLPFPSVLHRVRVAVTANVLEGIWPRTPTFRCVR